MCEPVIALRSGLKKASVLPVVGFPDSPLLFERRREFDDQRIEFAMVYDGLGIQSQRLEYLEWLNQQLKGFQSIPIMDLTLVQDPVNDMRPAIFLSAGVPDDPGRGAYIETADPIATRDAERVASAVVLASPRALVFGGHPAISPLVAQIADS